MNEDKKRLQKMVDDIAADINEGTTYEERGIDHEEYDAEPEDTITGFHYLEDCLDVEFMVSSSGDYLGARILVSYGGPNIWVNTRTQTVEGYWWGDECRANYYRDPMGVDEAAQEYHGCLAMEVAR